MQISVDRQCLFTHPGFGQDGRWYGACDNGVASGRGYGLIMNARGDTVEYIGDAQKGLASGSGGMIIQRNGQIGAIYYEGGFKNGLPDGVVRVETAGELPKLRQYKNGADIGKGDAASLQSLNFASNPGIAGPLTP
jgi:hypothetical protein